MILNESQVYEYLYNAGFRNQALDYAVRICKCESGYNTEAHNTNGEDSRGLMQINVAANANPQFKHLDLFNPQINCNVAFQIFNGWGKNFRAWTCARNLGLEYPAIIPEINYLIPIALIGLTAYLIS